MLNIPVTDLKMTITLIFDISLLPRADLATWFQCWWMMKVSSVAVSPCLAVLTKSLNYLCNLHWPAFLIDLFLLESLTIFYTLNVPPDLNFWTIYLKFKRRFSNYVNQYYWYWLFVKKFKLILFGNLAVYLTHIYLYVPSYISVKSLAIEHISSVISGSSLT